MPLRSNAIPLFIILLSNVSISKGQSQYPLRKVYAVEKGDGTVCILAENHGSMPFTTLVRAKLINMRSDTPLPLRKIILPSANTFLLATLTPTANEHSYKYTYNNLDGVYTGHPPDTSYVYRLPYSIPDSHILPQKIKDNEQKNKNLASIRYLYNIQLPVHTPICAARAGTVVAVKQEAKNSKTINANLVFIMHDDGSYSSYENIGKGSVVGRVGRPVNAGDTIAYFEENKNNPYFWFCVQYPADSLTVTVPVTFRAGQQLIRPR